MKKIVKCKLLCEKHRAIVFAVISIIFIVGLILLFVFTSAKYKGAVVSNGKGCAEIGGQMLKDGGTAVDAAIATLLCECVIVPQSMGIGGGFVATIYTKSSKTIETLIARERAPAAATENMYIGKTITGAIATGIPGELKGYWEMHKKYGHLPWKQLFQPTIKLCNEGHKVSDFLERALKETEKEIRNSPTMSKIFVKKDGTLSKEGDYIKRPQLGKTLETIAKKGIGELYDGGEIGKNLVNDIQNLGGIITLQDLKDYKVTWKGSDHATTKINDDYTLYTTPLPTSGPLLAFMINVMKDLYTDDTEIYWQRVIETFKHTYGRRSFLGDFENDAQMRSIIEAALNELKDQNFVKKTRRKIFDDRTFQNPTYYGANFTLTNDQGTANIAVLAPNGDAITLTSTINTHFGGKVRSESTGIILNDEMDDFSTPGTVNAYGVPASPSNYIKPGKRPMSSMCPSIILDKNGDVRLLVGAAGGSKITTSVATVILKYILMEQDIKRAVDDDRLHHQLVPMHIDVEADVPKNIQNYLKSIGHKMNILLQKTGFTAVTAIGFRSGSATPHFDRRREGSVFVLK